MPMRVVSVMMKRRTESRATGQVHNFGGIVIFVFVMIIVAMV